MVCGDVNHYNTRLRQACNGDNVDRNPNLIINTCIQVNTTDTLECLLVFYNLLQLVENTRKVFQSGRTLSLEWRRRQLQALIRMCKEQEDAFCQAIFKDLHKVC